MSRIQVVKDPAAPGKCLICNRSSNGVTDFLDFDVSFDYYGAVVICEDCVRECLEHVENTKYQKLYEQHQSVCEQLKVANDELNAVKSIFDGLAIVRPDLDTLSVDDESQSENSSESDEPAGKDLSDSVGEVESSEPDSDESNSSGGLADFSIFAK